MTEQSIAKPDPSALVEQVIVLGDLAKLNPEQRAQYYRQVCLSLKLNPLTRPFSYLTLNGRLTLYANKDAAEQLRKLNDISIERLERAMEDGIYIVTAYAKDKTGRTDSSIGAVAVEGLKGADKANALMKAETKAKRRVTLSISGLGMLDENEVEAISDARPVASDIVEPSRPTTPTPPAVPGEPMKVAQAIPPAANGQASNNLNLDVLIRQAQGLLDHPPSSLAAAEFQAIRRNWERLYEVARAEGVPDYQTYSIEAGANPSQFLSRIAALGGKLREFREQVASGKAK